MTRMIKLPPIPWRVAQLPVSDRGYPVPWFVRWAKDGKACAAGEGEPDFRIIAEGKRAMAVSACRCWICGQRLGVHRVCVIGPMCLINRVTSEPPSHRDCAEFAARACPWLTNPQEKRSAKNLPEFRFVCVCVSGEHIERNPGVVCLYETRSIKPVADGGGSYLFKLGDPDRLDWFARGRPATRAEIDESIRTGYPLLRAAAARDGAAALAELAAMRAAAEQLLPAA